MQNGSNEARVVNLTTNHVRLGFSGRCTLPEMIKKLEEQRNSALDVTVQAKKVAVQSTEKGLALVGRTPDSKEFFSGEIIRHAAVPDLCGMLPVNMPVDYARKMAASDPVSLANFLTDQLGKVERNFFVRMLNGQIRSIRSDSYRRLDNIDVALASLSVVKDLGAFIFDCFVDESRMRLRVVNYNAIEKVRSEFTGKDPHQFIQFGEKGNKHVRGLAKMHDPGKNIPEGGTPEDVYPIVDITNGEAGDGGTNVTGGFLMRACVNGLIGIEQIVRFSHRGSRLDEGVYAADTLRMEDEVLIKKLRDNIRFGLSQENLQKTVAKINATAEVPIDEPVRMVSAIGLNLGLTQKSCDSLLTYFLGDYSRTQGGLGQALSRLAQDTDDLDTTRNLERAAFGLLTGEESLPELPPVPEESDALVLN